MTDPASRVGALVAGALCALLAASCSDAAATSGADADAAEDVGSGGDGADEVEPNRIFQTCLDRWPAPSTATPQAALAQTPAVLWSVPVPPGPGGQGPLISTAAGAIVATGSTVLLIGPAGQTLASLPSANGEFVSGPTADNVGNVYWADASYVYSVDPAGKQRWRSPLGAKVSSGELQAPFSPLVSDTGTVYLTGLDGNLTMLKSGDGSAVTSPPFIGLISGQRPRTIYMGVGGILFTDHEAGHLGLLDASLGTWEGDVVIPDAPAWIPSFVMGGGTIGLVVSGYAETESRLGTTETVITDPCGRIRWKVPATTTFPLAVTFGDDLIVEDQQANGSQIDIGLRRFSAKGTLVAGPVASEPVADGVVGADDTLYLVSCPASGAILIARDASLATLWTLPLGAGACPDEYVLGAGGIFYFLRQGAASATLTAVQTTSPGPATGFWSRWNHNAEGNRWLDVTPHR